MNNGDIGTTLSSRQADGDVISRGAEVTRLTCAAGWAYRCNVRGQNDVIKTTECATLCFNQQLCQLLKSASRAFQWKLLM